MNTRPLRAVQVGNTVFIVCSTACQEEMLDKQPPHTALAVRVVPQPRDTICSWCYSSLVPGEKP